MPLTFAETPLYYKDDQGQYHRIMTGADMTGYRTAAEQDAIDAAQDAEIAEIQATEQYHSIAVSTTSSDISSIGAYAENGVVVLTVVVPAGVAAGWHNDLAISIPDEYAPRNQMFGTYRVSTMADGGKIFFPILHAAKHFQYYINESPAGQITAQFVYPVRTT